MMVLKNHFYDNNPVTVAGFLDLPKNKLTKLTIPGAEEPSDHFSLVYDLQISYAQAFKDELDRKEADEKA